MTGWIKSLAAAACLLTIFLHLVPENSFAKYVRFYAGLLFFLLAVQPVLELLGSADELERLLQLEFLKEEYYDLESAAEGLNDLKNDQILEAYQNELERQAAGIASAYGMTVTGIEIEFGEDGYSVKAVSVLAESALPDTAADSAAEIERRKAAAAEELADLYAIPDSYVEITVQNL